MVHGHGWLITPWIFHFYKKSHSITCGVPLCVWRVMLYVEHRVVCEFRKCTMYVRPSTAWTVLTDNGHFVIHVFTTSSCTMLERMGNSSHPVLILTSLIFWCFVVILYIFYINDIFMNSYLYTGSCHPTWLCILWRITARQIWYICTYLLYNDKTVMKAYWFWSIPIFIHPRTTISM